VNKKRDDQRQIQIENSINMLDSPLGDPKWFGSALTPRLTFQMSDLRYKTDHLTKPDDPFGEQTSNQNKSKKINCNSIVIICWFTFFWTRLNWKSLFFEERKNLLFIATSTYMWINNVNFIFIHVSLRLQPFRAHENGGNGQVSRDWLDGT
jgi:hypothetical protein